MKNHFLTLLLLRLISYYCFKSLRLLRCNTYALLHGKYRTRFLWIGLRKPVLFSISALKITELRSHLLHKQIEVSFFRYQRIGMTKFKNEFWLPCSSLKA